VGGSGAALGASGEGGARNGGVESLAGAAGERAAGGGTGPNDCTLAEGGEAGSTAATLPELVGAWAYTDYNLGADYILEVHADGTAVYSLDMGDIFGTFHETWSGTISVDQFALTLDATTVTSGGTQSEPGQSGRPSGTRMEPPQTLRFSYAYHADSKVLWLKQCDQVRQALSTNGAVPFTRN
jgi:hypothetical protein